MRNLPATEEEVEQFLSRRLDGVTRVTVLGSGEWSRAYAFRSGGRELVVRFSQWQEDFRKDELARRFSTEDMPVPSVVRIGAAPGGYYAVTDRAFGGAFDDFDPGKMPELFPQILAVLDDLRNTDVTASTGYGRWDRDGHAPDISWRRFLLAIAGDPPGRTHGWREKLARWPRREKAFDEAFRRLISLSERCPEERHLVHADLLNGNVIVAHGRVSAVIDWGQAMYGDFLYDLAWLSFWSFWAPSLRGFDVEQQALARYRDIGLNVPDFDLRLRCCKLHIGLDSQAYSAFKERWEFVDEVAELTVKAAGER